MEEKQLLGTAEYISERWWPRLSRSADPSRPRIDTENPDLTEDEARRIADELSRRAIERGYERTRRFRAPGDPKAEPIEKWAERWCKDREKRHVVEDARHDEGRLNEHVYPHLRGIPMADVAREDIERVVSALDEKVVAEKTSWKTALNVWGVVTKMFKDAYMSKNRSLRVREDDPTEGVEPPERGEEKAKAFVYPNEFMQLITSPAIWEASGSRVAASFGAQRWMRVFTIAIYLQMRAGELRSLRWEDIDVEHWICHVHRATKRDTAGKIEKRTKTGITRRFEIEPALRPLLLAMREEAKTAKLEAARDAGRTLTPEELERAILGERVLDMPHECDLSERLARYLDWAGVKRAELFAKDATRCSITFKDLRATGITWRAIRGDEPLKIQRAAGHKSLNTTQIYIRIAEDLGGAVGVPFPELPERLLGAWPKAGPNLTQGISKSSESQGIVASPAGFESRKEPVFMGILTCLGQSERPNDPKRPSTPALLGQLDAVEEALRAGLATAIEAMDWDRAAQLTGELRARAAAKADPKIVPIWATGR